jgi:hypothetical protein
LKPCNFKGLIAIHYRPVALSEVVPVLHDVPLLEGVSSAYLNNKPGRCMGE